jgi:hypothetical protein
MVTGFRSYPTVVRVMSANQKESTNDLGNCC